MVLPFGTIIGGGTSRKHDRTLKSIFATPVQSNVKWKDCEALLLHLGAIMSEGEGSRVSIKLKDMRAVFHRPHPKKEIDKGALMSLRRFLANAGFIP